MKKLIQDSAIGLITFTSECLYLEYHDYKKIPNRCMLELKSGLVINWSIVLFVGDLYEEVEFESRVFCQMLIDETSRVYVLYDTKLFHVS